nr:MAG TPA: SOS-response transcriptional repressor [Caudoviricetes sp.]
MGVTRIAVYFWEDGTCAPAVKRLPELAKLYGCTVDELLAGDETEKQERRK